MRFGFSLLVFVFITTSSCQPGNNHSSLIYDSTGVDDNIDEIEETIVIPKATRVKKLPDFTRFKDVNKKKKAFFEFLRPMVEEENSRLTAERTKLLELFEKFEIEKTLSEKDTMWLGKKARALRVKDFDINDPATRLKLEKKLDIVPASLFLAQAANESAWGTSRFARQANNLFGQWCFTPGCGIVPTKRGPNETHEVRKFETVNDAVRSYVTNINRHYAYQELRTLRYEQRLNDKTPTGMVCAAGLLNYSTRREEYVKEIRAMIKKNKLEPIESNKL